MRVILSLGLTLTVAVVLPRSVEAQTPTSIPAAGTLTIERVEQGVVYAPDVRITEVDDRTATLIGGYVGWMTDRTWLVGGGGYWLANQDDDLEMAYGGMVVEWLGRGEERIGFGIRGLVGGGYATIGSTVGEYWGGDIAAPGGWNRHRGGFRGGHGGGGVIDAGTPLLVSEYFFVAEPQASAVIQFARWARLNVGVGYRLTAGAGPLDDDLSGASASIAIQFGGGARAKP